MVTLCIAMTMALTGAPLQLEPSNIMVAEQKSPVKIALVIGYNRSDTKDTQDLRYADDDAIALHQMFEQAGIESNLLVEADSNTLRLHPQVETSLIPSKENILWTYEQILNRLSKLKAEGKQTELIITYSGHGGLENGQGYIVLHESRLTRSELHNQFLNRSNATRNHVIIDACKSFFVVFEKGASQGQRQFYPGNYVKDVKNSLFQNTGFILSTSSDRDSHEWEKYQAGVFSHEVRSALWGTADINGNRKVSYAEIGAFLTVANQTIPNVKYRPDFIIRPPGLPPGNLNHDLITWSSNTSSLLLDDQAVGHVYIEAANGQRVMDINIQPKDPVLIQLPEGRPIFVRKNDNSSEYQINETNLEKFSNLVPEPTNFVVKGARHLAFEDIFKSTFNEQAVEQYRIAYESFGDPLRLDLVEHFETLENINQVKSVAFWTGVATLTGGISCHISSHLVKNANTDSSQADRLDANNQINTLNTFAIGLYSAAAISATTWLVGHLWPVKEVKEQKDIELVLSLTPEYTGIAFDIPLQ